MRVFVNGKVYDTADEQIGILLTNDDKKNIAKMSKDHTCYIAGPTLNQKEADEIGDALKQESEG